MAEDTRHEPPLSTPTNTRGYAQPCILIPPQGERQNEGGTEGEGEDGERRRKGES